MADDELPPDPEGDPFEGLTLDEDFVRRAPVVEDSAAERLARQARIDAEHRRLEQEREVQRAALDRSLRRQARRHRRAGHPARSRLVVIGLLGALFVTLVLWNARGGSQRAVLGGGIFGDASAGSVTDFPRPSAGVEAADAPLGAPAPLARDSTAYRFIATQEGSSEPVAYDPCRPIHVVVNGRTAFAGADEVVQAALDAASRATGLQFVVDGLTEEAPDPEREPYQPERYGDRWAPVLISWSDPTETPGLEGDVAGLAGSAYVSVGRGAVYVTGSVELDGPQLARVALGLDGLSGVRAVVEHELGHLLGLDHVEDPTQLMNPTGGTVTSYADGDLTGLSRLGQGECFTEV